MRIAIDKQFIAILKKVSTISSLKSQADGQLKAGSIHHKFCLNALADQELVIENPCLVEVRTAVFFDNGTFVFTKGP